MHYPITFEAKPSQDDIQRLYDGISVWRLTQYRS